MSTYQSLLSLSVRVLFGAALAAGVIAVPRVAVAQAEVFTGDQLTTRPKIMSAAKTAQLVKNSYPSELQRNGIGGSVEIQFIIGADGKVEPASVEVVAASVPALGAAAKKVAEQLQFQPAKVNDKAVRTVVTLPIVYKAN